MVVEENVRTVPQTLSVRDADAGGQTCRIAYNDVSVGKARETLAGDAVRVAVFIVWLIGTAVSTWITGLVMRRRMRRALGRRVNESELTSIKSWMRVTEIEQVGHSDPMK